jgi:hypothetical protein
MAETDKRTCRICGKEHGQCFICESICFAVDGAGEPSAERALFVGFAAGLGAQLRAGTDAHETVQLMLGKLCEEHKTLWDELSSRTTSRMRASQS